MLRFSMGSVASSLAAVFGTPDADVVEEAPHTWERELAFADPVDRAAVAGFLHMLYHVYHAPNLYTPSRADRQARCKFCPHDVAPATSSSEDLLTMNFDSAGLASAIALRAPRNGATVHQLKPTKPVVHSCVYCGFRGTDLVDDGPGKYACGDDDACEARVIQRIQQVGRAKSGTSVIALRPGAKIEPTARPAGAGSLVSTVLDLDAAAVRGAKGDERVAEDDERTPSTSTDWWNGPLRISSTLGLPRDALLGRFVVLAKSGAGKTNGNVVFAEECFNAGLPVWQLDPLGNLRGMRSSGDGQSPGLAIPIIGGPNGDLPLVDPELLCEVVVTYGISVIIDVSELTIEEQRDYAERFLRNMVPLAIRIGAIGHVILHEADRYAPNSVGRNDVKTFARTAQNACIGWTFATQRPQILSPEVVESATAVIAMQIGSGLAQESIGRKISGLFDNRAEMRAVLNELPRLRKGEAWLLPDPDWLPDVENAGPMRFMFRLRHTFDARSRKRVDERMLVASAFADVDVSAIEDAVAKAAASFGAAAGDAENAGDDAGGVVSPATAIENLLRERISELEEQLALALARSSEAPKSSPIEADTTVALEEPAPAKRARRRSEAPADLERAILVELVRRLPQQHTTRAMLSVLTGAQVGALKGPLERLRQKSHISLTRGWHGGIALTSAALAELGVRHAAGAR